VLAFTVIVPNSQHLLYFTQRAWPRGGKGSGPPPNRNVASHG